MLPEHILHSPEHAAIAEKAALWCAYMEENLDFSLRHSRIHGRPHCARVLLLALGIAHRTGYEDVEDALAHAAIFHDTRRRDEGRDQGHGARAAYYYISFCREHGLPYSQRAASIMTWHDQSDAEGLDAIVRQAGGHRAAKGWLEAYRIFKDADALDRVRLGEAGLNVRMLRTGAARGMVDLARQLFGAFQP